MNKKIYLKNNNVLFESIIIRKRLEIVTLIKKITKKYKINNILDVGTTNDKDNKSSNFIIKNLYKSLKRKSISDQIITSNIFEKKLRKSITKEFSKKEIYDFKSDLVISSATIEHVGSIRNQETMIKNIINFTKKIFILTTPNKYYPIEFHTKLPFIHWLPKKIFRFLLKLFFYHFFSYEKNLNLLYDSYLKKILDKFRNKITYKIYYIKLLCIKSNLVVLGIK